VRRFLALALCGSLFFRFKQTRRRLEDDAGFPDEHRRDGNYVPIPSRVKESEVQGRNIRYEIDADETRRDAREVAELDARTILFAGESIALGWASRTSRATRASLARTRRSIGQTSPVTAVLRATRLSCGFARRFRGLPGRSPS